MRAGDTRKYYTAVTPFAGSAKNDEAAQIDLRSLMEPGEEVYVVGERPPGVAGLRLELTIPGLQMIAPEGSRGPVMAESDAPVQEMSPADAEAMVALTTLAFPGFFRIRTHEMGRYYGVREGGRLVAMAGERMVFGRFREISGVCTHPDARGRGLAALLIERLRVDHAQDGLQSFLHVSALNTRAIALYQRLGFVVHHTTQFHRLVREDAGTALAPLEV